MKGYRCKSFGIFSRLGTGKDENGLDLRCNVYRDVHVYSSPKECFVGGDFPRFGISQMFKFWYRLFFLGEVNLPTM